MTAVCESGWDWASNSFNQNPCAIAGALEAPCRGLASYTLGPLNNTNYIAPPKGSALACECNTVMYSLFMACTACQGQKIQSWTSWDQNCVTVFVTQYPLEIPTDTAIPAWAYLNVTVANKWDPVASEAILNLPESTGSGPTIATVNPSSTSTRTGSDSFPTLNTPNSSNSGGGGSHAGAIAGGVVGGLVALGVIAALVVWFVVKNRRSKVAPSSAFIKDYSPQNNYPKYDQPPPPPAVPYSAPQMKYNPSDPPIFPTPVYEPSFGATTGYPQTTYDPYPQRRGQYSGAPEV
ncbi:hypothetical protein BJ322DRAFT_1050323 [Thelephora terrestris]|uniref:Transmembrane protein n=1 Tax=Thelephora terrestris TaxID=56493 RepID=A0A9P6LA23_9AGAM|nr:hypothetical protein BJ322DRAFT_1050323 [Thelephora terrestris]